MASTAGSPSSDGLGKNLQLGSMSHESQKLNLTIEDVYELGKDIAQEMQKITADYGNSCLEGLVEKVVKSLEWLENYIEEIEELRKSKCKLMLKEDELACEKERRRKLQLDLKGLTLVVEERGRQRDLFATRLSELENQNRQYQELLTAHEQALTHMQRSKRYSIGTVEENGDDCNSRSRSLDRREMKHLRGHKSKEKDMIIDQLQKEVAHDKKQITEMRESRTLDQRRAQQRLKHMENEVMNLTKQLSLAQMQIERLNQEKSALIERSEVITEVKAIQLATVARQTNGDRFEESESESDTMPKFFKKDLLMILQDRNELKEKLATIQEELTFVKRRLSLYEPPGSEGSSKEHSPRSRRSSQNCTPIKDIRERVEGSMVILDVPNFTDSPVNYRHRSSYNHISSDSVGSLFNHSCSSQSIDQTNHDSRNLDDSTSL